MSQTTAPNDNDSTEEQDADSVAETLREEVSFAESMLESVTDDDLEQVSDEQLVKLRTALKELETTVESVRKDQADPVLKDRIEVGEYLHGMKHVESHNKYVAEDVGTVIMRAVGQGVDYTEFVEIKASKLAESDVEAEIGKYEYTYLL